MKSSRVQIVATIGPASGTHAVLGDMVKHHMDVARFNFSWGTHDEHERYIFALRQVAREAGVRIPIIQDLSGPRKTTESGHSFDEGQSNTRRGVLTEKDIEDLRFGLSKGVEYVCVSYIGSQGDVEEAKKAILEMKGSAKVIAKIERLEALENADLIIASADAVMIGRGDLAQEVPVEEIPFIQKELIEKCNRARKPVITATEMMLSMVSNPRPTRAEVTDVAYAVLCGSDALMLSEETARGAYPVETVAAMEKIALEAERRIPSKRRNFL